MAYFALLKDNRVQRVHVVADAVLKDETGEINEQLGKQFLQSLHGIDASLWIQCSMNGEFRGHSIARGYIYDEERDAFIPPKPYESWVLDEATCLWTAPVPMPEETDEEGNPVPYVWDETAGEWVVSE